MYIVYIEHRIYIIALIFLKKQKNDLQIILRDDKSQSFGVEPGGVAPESVKCTYKPKKLAPFLKVITFISRQIIFESYKFFIKHSNNK